MRRLAGLLALAWPLVLAASAGGASAIDGFDFEDAADAARYRGMLQEFRCPKCLNESLASSGAPIAVDLRRAVRRLLEAGETDAAIRAHLQERYGDFVLYDPPLKRSTWLLWYAPLLLLGVAAAVLARMLRRAAPAPSEAELRRARELLRSGE